jgi:hypothetical protein
MVRHKVSKQVRFVNLCCILSFNGASAHNCRLISGPGFGQGPGHPCSNFRIFLGLRAGLSTVFLDGSDCANVRSAALLPDDRRICVLSSFSMVPRIWVVSETFLLPLPSFTLRSRRKLGVDGSLSSCACTLVHPLHFCFLYDPHLVHQPTFLSLHDALAPSLVHTPSHEGTR